MGQTTGKSDDLPAIRSKVLINRLCSVIHGQPGPARTIMERFPIGSSFFVLAAHKRYDVFSKDVCTFVVNMQCWCQKPISVTIYKINVVYVCFYSVCVGWCKCHYNDSCCNEVQLYNP